MSLYEITGTTEITCTECSTYNADVSGELVGETDDKEVHKVVCENCGSGGEVIRETTLGGETQIADGFEEF